MNTKFASSIKRPVILSAIIPLLMFLQSQVYGSEQSVYQSDPFVLNQPNRELSPYTGMDRQDWVDAGVHILEGAFQYVDKLETPMFLPKQPGKSYPREGNENAPQQQRSAAIFEAIARTFNVAAPLLAENPDLVINGIHLGDYYKYHFLQLLCNDDSDYFIGRAASYDKGVQQVCELGNLAMWSILLPEVFWDRLTQEEKDDVARTLSEWGHGWTKSHNWRWFSVMMLTFLDLNGYQADRELMTSHVDNLILHYAGDGWYRDTSYDYYTAHVFQLYGAVWSNHYGRKYEPGRALVIDRNFDEFATSYQMIFSREGHVNMYGRSILYRLGASAGMSAMALRDKPSDISFGNARRVASGSLLQFIGHPDFFNQGLPSLGFYGPFEPGIQSYSCSASPYWMFLNFAGLILPESHPYWSEKEALGPWGNITEQDIRNEYFAGPGMLVSNHGPSGASELRPGKVHNKNPNYCRMVYSTAFPWEADRKTGATSSALKLKGNGQHKTESLPVYVDDAGQRDNVFYRQASFSKSHHSAIVDMATIVIPGGEIRIDRLRKISETSLYLGHFSMPHIDHVEPDIEHKKVDGVDSIVVKIPGRQLAITNYKGWGKIGTVLNEGLHPDAAHSTLLYAEVHDQERRYGPVEILISVLLHKTDDQEWSIDELQPIKEVKQRIDGVPYQLGGLTLELKNGQTFDVDFQAMDGACSRF